MNAAAKPIARPAATPARAPKGEVIEIQIARRQLRMSDDDYYAMLMGVGRVKSSTELDHAGRQKVLAHLRACGYRPAYRQGKRVAPDRKALWAKVGALLADARLPPGYADGMAQNMFQVSRAEWLKPDQLHKLVAALVYAQARRKKRAAAATAAASTTQEGGPL